MTTNTINRNVDTFGPEDLARPEIKLLQNTGGNDAKAAGAKPGEFYNAMTGEVYQDGFEFIPVDFFIQRVYWGRDVIGDEPPMCSSLNANSFESVTGIDCHTCAHRLDNAAAVDAKARREKCTKQYSFMGLLLPNLEPFIFRAPGTSSQAVINLYSRFKFNKECWNAERSAIDFHRFKVRVSSFETKTAAGSAYVIRLNEVTPLADSNFEQETFLLTAQILGQSVDYLPSPPENERLTDGKTSTPTAAKVEQPPAPPAPKVTNVTPPPVEKPAPPATKPKSRGMNLDI